MIDSGHEMTIDELRYEDELISSGGMKLLPVNDGVRRFHRITTDSKAYITTPMMDDDSIGATLVQLGLGGGLLQHTDYLGVGRIVTLDLFIDKRPVRAIAKVLYEYREAAGDIQSGFCFEYIDSSHSCRLNDFIDACIPDQKVATA